MRIRIDRGPKLHVPVMRDGVATMLALCGARAVVEYRYALEGRVEDLCAECTRLQDAQKQNAAQPVKAGGE